MDRPAVAVRKRVGGYVVGDTVGEGSFGKVRMGTHTDTEERVAMKIIDKRLVAKREYVRKNLRREAVVLQRLSHPNIIRLYEVLETSNNYYLVMEFAEGGPFMKYLCERKKLSERETRKFMRQLVSAVEFMHQADVVHRDIKVENFLLDEDMNLKVIDFGLSNIMGSDGLLKTQCGSPAYAAPEIFCNASYGPAVDVWSIGVNMFAMLTGELPFTVDPPTNMTKLHAKIMQGCTIPQHLTRECKDLLGKLLTADEKERISLCDVMRHPWINRGYTRRLYPSEFPNRLTNEQLDTSVISSLVSGGFTESVIRDAVTQNRPIAETAGYHLLRKRVSNGWGFPDGRLSVTNNQLGSPAEEVVDLESTSLIFTPAPPPAAGGSSRPCSSRSRPGSSRRSRPSSSVTKHDRAKSQLAAKPNTIEQENRLKSTHASDPKIPVPLLSIDARKSKPTPREDPPTREIVLEDMRKKLSHYLEKEVKNNEINTKDNNPVIVISRSIGENYSSDRQRHRQAIEIEDIVETLSIQTVCDSNISSGSPRKHVPKPDIETQVMGPSGASPPMKTAAQRGCMIIVNGKLAKGDLFSEDTLKKRSAWTSDAFRESPTPSVRSRALRRGPGVMHRSQTDPGQGYPSMTLEPNRESLSRMLKNRDTHAPYQSHGAFPAHRLGLYYSVTRPQHHYPGTPHESRRGGNQTTRTRSHTAPNGRSVPGVHLRHGPSTLRSAHFSGNKRLDSGNLGPGSDLSLPKINTYRVGCQ
ncbi:uncharacterized protein [Asterias amurensis]|uniref:uncharacterized protein n=1 Tax=Asterias amurensis TaxID=7602 RepID=UPI003AB13DD1